MFSGDDVFKPLGVLSGGERNRYAMAKMLVSPANMLLLDEPTNHLDLRAKDVLLEAIANFTGTVLFVSHDRYFIDGLATRVFEVEDHRVHIYPGNYEDYLWRKSGGPEKVAVSLTDSLKPTPPSSVILPLNEVKAKDTRTSHEEPQPTASQSTLVKRLNPIKLKQLEDRVAAIEQETRCYRLSHRRRRAEPRPLRLRRRVAAHRRLARHTPRPTHRPARRVGIARLHPGRPIHPLPRLNAPPPLSLH